MMQFALAQNVAAPRQKIAGSTTQHAASPNALSDSPMTANLVLLSAFSLIAMATTCTDAQHPRAHAYPHPKMQHYIN